MAQVTIQRLAGKEFMDLGPFGVCWPSIGLVSTEEAHAFAILLVRAIESAEHLNREDAALAACNRKAGVQ